MKNKGPLLTAIIFFLIVNTTYYWEGKLGTWVMPLTLILWAIYVALGIILIGQIYSAVKEKLADKSRLVLIVVLIAVLTLTFVKPFGLIDFDKREGEIVLLAEREGSANCMTTFTLKNDLTFKERNVCFGVSEVIGNYRVSNDTIYFESVKLGKQEDVPYEFAIIEEVEHYTENPYVLKLFKDKNDTIGFHYWINVNKLKINPKEKQKI